MAEVSTLLPPETDLRPRHRAFEGIDWSRIDVVSVDVFDTLVLRKPVSERARVWRVARREAELLAAAGLPRSAEALYRARSVAWRFAFRITDMRAPPGEGRMEDIVDRQLELLALPPDLRERFLEIEREVDSACLRPNAPLIAALEVIARSGRPVHAISDTPWSAPDVRRLLDGAGARPPLAGIHSSADLGLTKRHGEIFEAVFAAIGTTKERVLHVGDDATADLDRARRAGASAAHVPRGRLHLVSRRAQGTLAEMGLRRGLRRSARTGREGTEGLVQEVIGPVVADILLRLWLHLRLSETRGDGPSVAAFCARGGLVMRRYLDMVLRGASLPLDTPRHDLMTSRVVAARAGLVRRAPSALAAIQRAYTNVSLAQGVAALAGPGLPVPGGQRPFTIDDLLAYLDDGAGEKARRRLEEQDALFRKSLDDMAEGCDRIVLVDTGLYGSTLQMMRDAYPDLRLEAAQIARCNHVGDAADHFPAIHGVVVERDRYSPLDARSAILRYWHFIELLFEPPLDSVTWLEARTDGSVGSNLQTPGWEDRLHGGFSFQPELDSYLGSLGPEDVAEMPARAERAFHRFRRVVLFPTAEEARLLGEGQRAHDFGLSGGDEIRLLGNPTDTLRELLGARWKEGALAVHRPLLRRAYQSALEGMYLARWLARG